MGRRKALLIGAEDYGEGFAQLPGVQQDIRILQSALQASGYETEICPSEVLTNASKLDATMRAFCSSGGAEDVRILYFTGHGLLADDVDWIVPAGTRRNDAMVSPNQRVSTDLSRTVAESKVGLVLFIVDACRDQEDVPVTKGTAAWGDPERLARPAEHRFVRFFGCAANQVCQVVTSTGGEPAYSLFSKALADSVAKANCVSLDELLPHVEKRCDELLSEHNYLRPQTPRLSYGGDLSVEKKMILQRPIFDPVGRAALSTIWESFDPEKLQCLVVLSEYELGQPPDWGLKEIVRDAVAGETGDKIWKSFRAGCNLRSLVSNKRRILPEAFEPSSISFGFFSVIEALASAEALDRAVAAVVEADLVVFDVTGFEPGVMFLIGIRSACCRSLSVCSHGAGWKEGQPLEDVPFNLQELNINSHTPAETRVGADPVVERFVRRVETGFYQVAKHPRYLDLPAYDALRQLGSRYEASSTIDVSERILVLCSYSETFYNNWRFVATRLKRVLWNKKIAPEIERIIDYGTSQLIWQSLYEQIRRTAACVVDWSEYSASVFLELGVRLAVSERGAVQIIDERYLPGGEKARKLTQIERMCRLLNPIPYRYRSDSLDAFETAAEALLRNPILDGEADYNRIHRVLLRVLGEVQEAHPSLVEELKSKADALHHPQQGRVAAPQILFHGSRIAKQDSEKAALELRIAAWLYLEHRVKGPTVKKDPTLRDLYLDLGRSAIDALYDLSDDESIELAGYIEDRLNKLD